MKMYAFERETWICSLYPVWMVLITLWFDTHSQNTQNTGTQHIKRQFDRTIDTQVTFQVALKPLNRSQNHLEMKITAETKREKLDNLLVQSEMTFCVCVSQCVFQKRVRSLCGGMFWLFILCLSFVLCPVRCFPQTPQGADDKCG